MPVKTHKYSNEEITVIWKPDTCIHSTHCWKDLIEVFSPREKPWIKMGGATTERIIEQVKKCPSGALSFVVNEAPAIQDQEVTEATPLAITENIIECLPNGPLLVTGDVLVKKSDGTEEKKSGTVALCRCGGSKNKPYCDGSHRMVGFVG